MKRTGSDQTETAEMKIRRLGEGDRAEVELLAARDTRPLPPGPLLGVEVWGRLLAATSLATGETVADPFVRSGEARAMLELRAAQLRRPNGRWRGLRLQLRRSSASLAGSPPGAGGRLLTLRGS
ncbi:MAG TPA: hypothetical protein VK919_13475 [Solirubrobacterales bacterium]|nr:hypothetical protein [Solirubrobacterales bacterium]